METKELWDQYKATDSVALRNQLVEQYLPLVYRNVGSIHKTLPSSVEYDDLIGDGTIGLIDAITKFDQTRGFKFDTYAITRIRGAIFDGLRKLDWVPRNVRSEIREFQNAKATCIATLQRKPTDAEVMDLLGWDEEDFWRVTARSAELIGGFESTSMSQSPETWDDTTVSLADTLSSQIDIPGTSDQLDTLRESLVRAINDLTERERVVLGLRYFHGLKFSQIGAMLEVAESRVSQIHTKAIRAIRETLVSGD